MKPFQGIIGDWRKTPLGPEHGLGFRIEGTCLRHEDRPAADAHRAMLRTTIKEGYTIYTSYAVKLDDMDGFSILETRNSRYILLGNPKA